MIGGCVRDPAGETGNLGTGVPMKSLLAFASLVDRISDTVYGQRSVVSAAVSADGAGNAVVRYVFGYGSNGWRNPVVSVRRHT